MACSVDSAIKAVKDNPAISLAVVETPLGALGVIFFFITSLFGMQYITKSDSIWELFKTTGKQIFAFLSPLLNRARKAGEKTFTQSWSWLMVYLLATIVTAALLINFAEATITWLTVGIGILFAFGLVAVVAKYYSSSVANALIAGAIFGTAIFIVYFLIAKSAAYTTGKVVPDLFFILFVVYIILAFVALGSIAGKHRCAGCGRGGG